MRQNTEHQTYKTEAQLNRELAAARRRAVSSVPLSRSQQNELLTEGHQSESQEQTKAN